MMLWNIRQPKNALRFIICLCAILWVIMSGRITVPFEILRLVLLSVLFFLIKTLFMKRIPSPTGSGAIVMAIGIFINGAIIHFPSLNREFASSLTVILVVIFLFIVGSYSSDLLRGEAFRRHFENHVGRFAVGTWIAGISVCGVALCQRLPEWKPLVKILVIGNIGLWLFFIVQAIGGFLAFSATGGWRKVHGVLFLGTVSTQSLLLVWKAAFGANGIYTLAAPWVIVFGIVLYVVSFLFVLRRYLDVGTAIDLDTDWFNTNCITHGAMSITGLACAVSGVVAINLTLLVWLWVIVWFALIETLEVARAVKRIRRYGVWEGLMVYDPTQWSRNFTFGMFYAFTLNFDIGKSLAADTILLSLHQAVLHYFAWVVLILLILEAIVFLRDRLSLPVSPHGAG